MSRPGHRLGKGNEAFGFWGRQSLRLKAECDEEEDGGGVRGRPRFRVPGCPGVTLYDGSNQHEEVVSANDWRPNSSSSMVPEDHEKGAAGLCEGEC